MQMLRILTFNWHDPYLHMFSQTGHEIFVGDWMQRADGTRGWDVEKRPLPDNLTLVPQPQEAVVYLKDGEIDVVVCHTLQDLSFVAPFDVPTVYLTHNALQNDGLNDPAGMVQLRNEIAMFLKGRNGVFAAISPMKLKSWDLEGFVVRPGIDLDAYGGYTGGNAVALAVGNLFVERDHMLGYRYMKEILDGVPHRLVGENPRLPEAKKAENWDDLKAAFRSCRVYVSTTVEEFEDGYNLGMLEAMATGMPVVSLQNATSPIRNGENGFVSGDTGTLKARVQDLLEDAELAKRLGKAARETVAQEFSVGAFVDNWNQILEASMERAQQGVYKGVVPAKVDLSIDMADLYLFTKEDVAAFLDVEDRDQIVMPKVKLDRVGAGYLCDVFLGNLHSGRSMVWQGLEVYPQPGGEPRIVWPAYLDGVDASVRQVVNAAIGKAVPEVEKQGPELSSIHVNLREPGEFVFGVGEDRVSPGEAPWEIYLHHAKRYVFARQFCVGKQVVDLGAGTGYGTRMLGRDADLVVGLDVSTEAQQFAQKTFGKGNARRLASDIRSLSLQNDQFDVAVCFEAIEHILEHEVLLNEVRRVLKSDGIFVVSTPNKIIYDSPGNANTYHVGMLELDDFRALLCRHFEDVDVYGQKRMEDGVPYYEAYGFRDSVTDEDEVFVAVCSVPKAEVLPPEGEAEEKTRMPAPLISVDAKTGQADGGGRRLKILFSHVSNPISMGRYYVDAFRKAHDVLTCGPVIDDAELAEWRKAETQHALKRADAGEVEKMGLISRLAEPCDIPMPRGQVDIDGVLSQLPPGWQPDLFVWIDSATAFLPMGLEELDCPSVSITVDTHTGQMDWRKEYARMFSHVFLVHHQHIGDFEAFGCAHVGWLPPACSATVHGKIPSDKAYDIGFVGQTHRQWHPHRVRLLQRLKDAGFDVHIESKILEEMTLFNSRSRIVFNRSLNGDVNMRVFEAMCAGSLVLTDRLPPEARLEDLLKDREHLVVYDEENLEALARHYLDHEAEREAIAEAGRQAVLSAHTYDHRADEMIAQVLGEEDIARCVSVGPTEAVVAGRQHWGREAPASISVTRGAGTKESAAVELAEYTGEPVPEVIAKLPKTGPALAKDWRSKDRTTQAAIDDFYQETEHYLYDLTDFNYEKMYVGWRGTVYNLCQQVSEGLPSMRVMDYGGGIGTTLIELSDLPGVQMTYGDLPGKTFDYASWRFQKRGLDVETLLLDGEDPLAGREFDVIVCMEVIEHLVDPEKMVRYLIDHLRPGGFLIITVTFYTNENGPFHLNCDRYNNEMFYGLVRNMGMQELTSYSPRVYQKTGAQAQAEAAPPAPVVQEVGAQTQVEAAPPVSVDQTHFDSPEKVQSFLTAWQGPVKLNLGCGEDRRDGYINVDAYVPSADLKMDIFKLVFADGTVDDIFSSHMLEHLGKYEVPNALAEWNRVLKPGGVLRLNLPDLEWVMGQWLKVSEEHRWGWAVDTIYGLQTHDGEYHKSGFTVGRVEQLLEEAGFGQVRVSWVWSHGLRCLWAEAVRPDAGEVPGVVQPLEMKHFEAQFPVDLSSLSPYTAEDCEAFFARGDWEIGLVSFEHLPMDGADYTVNVAVKKGKDQMVLQGMQMFDVKGNPYLVFPDYLKDQSESMRETLGQAIGEALGQKLNDPAYQDGAFVVARFNERGDLGLEQTGERVIPGLTDYSLYIPHMKRYLLAERYAEGARVLDAGCGTGYGAKRLARLAEHIDAVDVCEDAIGFARRTYADEKVNWQVADLLAFEPEEGTYDLVTSFEVIEHLSEAEIPVYLDCVQRALKPGGVALISTPNHLVAQQWDNPFHKTEMTLDAFRNVLTPVFGDVTVLGQTVWSNQTEVPGQCAISGRVTDEDDMFIAVCTRQVVSGKRPSDIPPQVSIVMPLYNQVAYTTACLEGLEKVHEKVPYELILVDNGSTDGTGDLLERMEDQARVIRPGQNLGFAKGNNLGAKEARGKYLLFLNNDTVPHRGWLDALVAEVDSDASIGIVGAKLLYPDTGKIQHAGIEIINGVPDHVHRHAEAQDPAVQEGRDLDMVTGACLMIRRDLFERLGGFDEGYVNGVEDVDLCLRARDLGFRVRYCAEAVLDHYEGKSEGRFDHVRPNLERFVKRWNGRFDGQGKFVPEVAAPELISPQNGVSAAGSETAVSKDGLRGCWEGTQFVYHSLSLVNMGLTSELIRSGCELKLIPFEPATFGPEVDPERLGPIAERINADLSGPAQFHVRHKWPPDFTPPPEGHWVMIQPWEFGKIPEDWVRPIQEGVDEVWVPSTYVKQCYVDSGIDADRVQVIPNGVRTDVFHPNAAPLKLDTDKSFKFLFVGGTIYRKGIDILLKVYRQTFTPEDDVCLVIKGMGDETFYKGQTAAEMIRTMQADPDAPKILYLTDDLTDEEMAGLYTACNSLVHPYRGEGFGMPVAEAMACALPVIVTQGGACDDFCSEDNAYFVTAKRREIRMQM